MSSYTFERLSKHHDRDRAGVDCGLPVLNRYLQRQASQDVRKHVATVWVMADEVEPSRVVGYFSLASFAVGVDQLDPKLAKGLPRYDPIPAIILGRLARDFRFPGSGKLLMMHAMKQAWESALNLAAAVLVVDAKDERSSHFYTRFGFVSVIDSPQRMYVPMRNVGRFVDSTIESSD